MECGRDSPLRHIYRRPEHLLLAETEADASVTEELNALTEADQIEGKVLEWERSGEGLDMRDRKRVVTKRMEGMEIGKEDKKLPITSFIIKAEVVKALQARSNLHHTLHLQNRPQC